MQLIKCLFEKFRSCIPSKKGVAVLEMAFFIPFGMMLLYMIVDMATLFRLKYQIQNLPITIAQNAVTLMKRNGKITINDLKQLSENAVMTLHGFNKSDNYKISISWQVINNNNGNNEYIWGGSTYKLANSNTFEFVDYGSHKFSLQMLPAPESFQNLLNINTNEGALVVGLELTQSSNKIHGISDITFRAIKNAFNGNFAGQSSVSLDENLVSLLPPTD